MAGGQQDSRPDSEKKVNGPESPPDASKLVEVEGVSVQEQVSIPAGAVFDRWSEDPWTNGVQVDRMGDMEKLVIQTRNSLYEITIIDGRSGEILVRGGQFFPELT